jgi:hypothetical protein
MTFELKYKDAPTFGKHGILRKDTTLACRVCGRPTVYVDIMTEEPVCSEECLNRLNNNEI